MWMMTEVVSVILTEIRSIRLEFLRLPRTSEKSLSSMTGQKDVLTPSILKLLATEMSHLSKMSLGGRFELLPLT